ncbi:hypothetical protein CCS01_18800 [Rhodopila globiformis]|uniref:Uncharacterized protein n=1 Tax=Rhodopila globiformis TaxID=1071 RepID=A0A2S6N7R5_RHOGL|nr:hypothetical protein CCS01_18800 [Rhodopila globiformis]
MAFPGPQQAARLQVRPGGLSCPAYLRIWRQVRAAGRLAVAAGAVGAPHRRIAVVVAVPR